MTCSKPKSEKITVISGRPTVFDPVGAIVQGDLSRQGSIERHARSFFQGNRYVLSSLVEAVCRRVDTGPVLDLYAGSGALGIEALSRGARYACFVECSRKHERVLKKNLQSCKLTKELYGVFFDRAEHWILSFQDPGNPSLVFLDPPYQENHYLQILNRISESDGIQNGSVVVIESPKKMEFEFPQNLEMIVQKIYGGTSLHLLEKH